VRLGRGLRATARTLQPRLVMPLRRIYRRRWRRWRRGSAPAGGGHEQVNPVNQHRFPWSVWGRAQFCERV
jgi:hypothetical protein